MEWVYGGNKQQVQYASAYASAEAPVRGRQGHVFASLFGARRRPMSRILRASDWRRNALTLSRFLCSMTSELSNALNPNAVPQRRRRSAYAHIQSQAAGPSVEQTRPEVQAPQPAYSRHRSELELAVIEPPHPTLPPPQ